MLSFLLSKTGIWLAAIVIIAVALAIVSRNWSCKKTRPPRPPRIRSSEYAVIKITSGSTILVKDRRREKTLILDGIIPPADETLNAASKANLVKLAGTTVRCEWEGGLFRDAESEAEEESLEAATLHGTVFGDLGVCLQIAQLRAGMCETLGKVTEEFIAAQAEAKKAKLGLWKDKK